MYVYIYIYVCMYIYIYIHTHEAALPPLLAAARRAGLVALVTVRPTWEDPY